MEQVPNNSPEIVSPTGISHSSECVDYSWMRGTLLCPRTPQVVFIAEKHTISIKENMYAYKQ